MDGDGVARCEADCDDADRNVWPGAVERCNGKDDDCDGLIDEEFLDRDKDGSDSCIEFLLRCNDEDAAVFPGASENCEDQKDNNCNGTINEGCPGGAIDVEAPPTLLPPVSTRPAIPPDGAAGLPGAGDDVELPRTLGGTRLRIRGGGGCDCSATATTPANWLWALIVFGLPLRSLTRRAGRRRATLHPQK